MALSLGGIMKLVNRISLAVVFALAVATTANAALTIDVNPAVSYQQTTNNPCVIGDPSCQQPSAGGSTMYYDRESGTPGFNGSTYDIFSTVYRAAATADLAHNIIPLSFILGIDVNFNNSTEYLVAFRTYVCTTGSVGTANSSAPGNTGVGPFPTGTAGTCNSPVLDAPNSTTGGPTALQTHNGNGFSDAILSTFNLVSGNYYVFEAAISNDSDGMVEFFLIPTDSVTTNPTGGQVPEPTSILLLGSALAVAGRLLKSRLSV